MRKSDFNVCLSHKYWLSVTCQALCWRREQSSQNQTRSFLSWSFLSHALVKSWQSFLHTRSHACAHMLHSKGPPALMLASPDSYQVAPVPQFFLRVSKLLRLTTRLLLPRGSHFCDSDILNFVRLLFHECMIEDLLTDLTSFHLFPTLVHEYKSIVGFQTPY